MCKMLFRQGKKGKQIGPHYWSSYIVQYIIEVFLFLHLSESQVLHNKKMPKKLIYQFKTDQSNIILKWKMCYTLSFKTNFSNKALKPISDNRKIIACVIKLSG